MVYIETKGDNNDSPDSWKIEQDQVFCKVPETSLLEKFKFAIVERR